MKYLLIVVILMPKVLLGQCNFIVSDTDKFEGTIIRKIERPIDVVTGDYRLVINPHQAIIDNITFNGLSYSLAYSPDNKHCLKPNCKIIFIFSDDSKLEKYNEGTTDCRSGQVLGTIYLYNKELDKFKKQSIKDVRVYFVEGHHDFLNVNTEMLDKAIKCMFP